ncbi:MAG: hypothetical protein K0S00_3971 [Xanthobacteraceae bacterium]|jgi:hypothetical protein|nr:hypothetical protein [Xanthobacteraceae bacterium]
MSNNELPETIYTLHEAAERLRTTPRVLARIARRYGRCAEIGRSLRFSEADIAALWQAIRVTAKEPWAYHAAPASAPTSDKAHARLLGRLSERRADKSLRDLMKRPRKPREPSG